MLSINSEPSTFVDIEYGVLGWENNPALECCQDGVVELGCNYPIANNYDDNPNNPGCPEHTDYDECGGPLQPDCNPYIPSSNP